MAGKITSFVVDFRTLIVMSTILMAASLHMSSKLEAIEKHIAENRIAVITEISSLHSEIAQHHTALATTEKQIASLDKKVMEHLLNRGVHK